MQCKTKVAKDKTNAKDNGIGPINNLQIEKKGLQNELDTKAQAQETFFKST
jgi:hypothetical protein